MSKTTYKAVIYFHANKDNYTAGQALETDNAWSLTIAANTTDELKEQIAEATYSKWDDIFRNDINEYDDASEYWTSYMADADNIGDASQAQIDEWKQDKLELWAVNCHILVSEVTETKAIL